MRRVVDGGAVEQNERLIRPATPDVETARIIRGRLHAGQQLQGSEYVRLQERRKRLDELRLELLYADLAGFVQLLPLPGDRDFLYALLFRE